MSHRFVQGLLSLAILSAGCQSVYRAETKIHANGSVERKIVQPIESVPKEARKKEIWEKCGHFQFDPESKQSAVNTIDWEHPDFLNRVLKDDTTQETYFVARGIFASPEAIPDHYVRESPEGASFKPGKLTREYRSTDHVFVTSYLWRETLTDNVSLEDMRRTLDEVSNVLIQVGEEVFEEGLGKEYDASSLFEWAKTEGKAWLVEIAEFAYVQSVRKDPAASKDFEDGFAKICSHHGMTIDPNRIVAVFENENGEKLNKSLEHLEKNFRDFGIELLCKHVRRKANGNTIDREMVLSWFEPVRPDDINDSKPNPSFYELTLEKVLDKKYGGGNVFQSRLFALAAPAVGLYVSDGLSSHLFDFTLKVPGKIVETNGSILAHDRVRWRFDGRSSFPLGRMMQCRYLVPQVQAQRDVLGSVVLADEAAMLRYLVLVDEKESDVLNVLRQCREQKSLAQLHAYRKKIGRREVIRVDELLELLEPRNSPQSASSQTFLFTFFGLASFVLLSGVCIRAFRGVRNTN